MELSQMARRGIVCAVLCALPAISIARPAIPQAEPNVHRAAGTPCVVELFHDQPFDDLTSYTYAPPLGCPGPWSKIVLKADLSGARFANTFVASARLGGVTLFNSGVSQTPTGSSWHIERDLTDYASLLGSPNDGELDMYFNEMPSSDAAITGSAELLFYRSTAATPAHRVPDAVLQADGELTLPHNIVRAYLDVTARAEPLWFTCVPDASASSWHALLSQLAPGVNPPGIFPAEQGCTGGSYREVDVSVDGTPAGVAPAFPWLPSDFNGILRNSVDQPLPGAQSLNLIPYRVDLTPFAGLLNAPGPHTVALSEGGWSDAQLVLYLDHGRSNVPGAVTFNSLLGGGPAPVVTNTLAASGDLLSGQVHTRVDRDYVVRGFVDTSSGRVRTVVRQSGTFDNRQDFAVDGLDYGHLHAYRQDVSLLSTIDRHSRRTRGGTVLDDDREWVRYPLTFKYDVTADFYDAGDGPVVYIASGHVAVDQKRHIRALHHKAGVHAYGTLLSDRFRATHAFADESDVERSSTRSYVFKDNFGSCYKKVLTSADGVLTGTTAGTGCPGGINWVRWFAHADGSPDGLNWLHP